jgi:hypothetical protein
MPAPYLTPSLEQALTRLAAAGVGVAVQMHLHTHTRKALIKHDWAVYSWKLGESYTLTGRGLAALKAWHGREKRRTDGLCPRCGIRERRGERGYCLPCGAAYSRERYSEKGSAGYRADVRCKCGKMRHVTKRGKVLALCNECLKKRNIYDRKRMGETMARLAEAGTPKLCKCGKPRYISPAGYGSSYCLDCASKGSLLSKRTTAFKKIVEKAHSSKGKQDNG